MKISVNTETEEIAELRAAVAIIEDAIKRRECSDEGEEESYDYDSETQAEGGEVSSYEIPPQQVEQPKVQERRIEPPMQERRIEPPVQERRIEPAIPERKVTPPPTVDMSALSKSTYGEKIEKRNMAGNYQPA